MKPKQAQLVLRSHDSALSTISEALSLVQNELDEYRECLNEGTNEIHSLYEYIHQVDKKVERALERLDELTLLVKDKKQGKEWLFTPLTSREKEVFQVVYVLTTHRPYTSYKEIAKRLKTTTNLVGNYITLLIQKGIPVQKKYFDGQVWITLHPEFRKAQAKGNIVGVNTLLTYWS